MKINISLWVITTLLFLGMTMVSCSKSDETTRHPRYSQLIGTWSGTTSQNQTIRIGIIAVDTILYVNTYKYNVLKYQADTVNNVIQYDLELSTMVVYLDDKSFIFRPHGGYSYYDYLKGTFDVDSLVLKGRFNTSFGASGDSVCGTYIARKVH